MAPAADLAAQHDLAVAAAVILVAAAGRSPAPAVHYGQGAVDQRTGAPQLPQQRRAAGFEFLNRDVYRIHIHKIALSGGIGKQKSGVVRFFSCPPSTVNPRRSGGGSAG